MQSCEIPLTQGKVALVDAKDYEDLSRFKWSFISGYAVRRRNANKAKCHEYMHRRILGEPLGRLVIHLDDDRLNNRRSNLIAAPTSIRQQRMPPRGACGYKGVSFIKGRYVAQIHLEGKTVFLGRFSEALDAARAYDLAALRHYGLAARLNYPLSPRELSMIVKAK